jgi:hypothetical protein
LKKYSVTKNRTVMPDSNIIFLHIIKAAGTTLHRVIEQQYKPQEIYSAYPSLFSPNASIGELANMPAERRAKIRVLKGHVHFGVHVLLTGPSTYFTLLRDPIERVLSYYYFVRQDHKHYLHDYAQTQGTDLRSFILGKSPQGVDNLQTRLLAGDWAQVPFGACTSEMLATAKRNLEQSFSVVGLVERFDETLLLLQRTFHWKNIFYIRHNVTSGRPQGEELPAGTLDLIRECNLLDLELYEYGKTLLEAQIQQQGPSFSDAVRRFQIRNRQLQPLLTIYWGAKKVSVRAFAYHMRKRLLERAAT